jgi:hypothetical protein
VLLEVVLETIVNRPNSGGGRAFDEERGRMVQKADQHTSSIALAFQRAKDEQKPIAVIAGEFHFINYAALRY